MRWGDRKALTSIWHMYRIVLRTGIFIGNRARNYAIGELPISIMVVKHHFHASSSTALSIIFFQGNQTFRPVRLPFYTHIRVSLSSKLLLKIPPPSHLSISREIDILKTYLKIS